MPSDFSTRRTVVADTPIPKNRFITSRMRRLPALGVCACVAKIAFARSSGGFFRFGCKTGLRASSEASPRSRYACTHCTAVV
jgi:hypothetical protein